MAEGLALEGADCIFGELLLLVEVESDRGLASREKAHVLSGVVIIADNLAPCWSRTKTFIESILASQEPFDILDRLLPHPDQLYDILEIK